MSLRAPVSESLTRLQRDQLQKFAQYLISELPQQILPTAQRLLDELLSSQPTTINTVCGAPDPTAGASANDQTNWYLDEKTLHDNIKKILIKFCLPTPMVFSDVNYLTNSAPPAAAEWSSLLRPLRGREPEGMWNLLSIVREMYRRCDRNAIRLLEIITEEVMACDQILVWWFNIKLALLVGSSGHSGGKHSNTHSNSNATQHACASLCDELVVLWRLAALNPGLAPDERDMLHAQFTSWHLKILDRVAKCMVASSSHSSKQQQNLRNDAELFAGFKPAIEACYLDWEDYPIEGITHTQDTNPMYHCPFTCFKSNGETKTDCCPAGQVNSSQAVLQNNVKQFHSNHHHHHGNLAVVSSSAAPSTSVANKNHHRRDRYRDRSYESSSNNSNSSSDSVPERLLNQSAKLNLPGKSGGGNRSSVSSEGFCENDEVDDVNVTETEDMVTATIHISSSTPSSSATVKNPLKSLDVNLSDSSNSSTSSGSLKRNQSSANEQTDISDNNSVMNEIEDIGVVSSASSSSLSTKTATSAKLGNSGNIELGEGEFKLVLKDYFREQFALILISVTFYLIFLILNL